jgi:hypothetical protein
MIMKATNTNKKTSARKKLLPAAGSLLISAAMLSTSTYAWFTMNKEVSVTGMKLKAQATDGIVISGDNKATWTTDWDVAMSTGIELYPTSTNGAVSPSWAVAYSKDFDDANKNQSGSGAYTDLSINYDATLASGTTFTSTVDGVGKAGSPTRNYVLKKTFWIKSTGEQTWDHAGLNIDEVTATATTESGSGTANLNKALRVLVVVSNANASETSSFIYAPFVGHDDDTKFKNTTTLTLKESDDQSVTAITDIPNVNDGAIRVDMYMYYEGEDENCKSSNIAAVSVDTLTVSAKFSTTDDPSTHTS